MESGRLVERKQKIRGLETAWLEGGCEGAPIMLFIHGYPDGPKSFEYQYSEFQSDFYVVAPYTRGCMPSQKNDDTDRYGHHAQSLDFVAILNIVDPDKKRPVIVLGHDLGASHAWFLASMLGERLHRLVIWNGLYIRQYAERYQDLQQLRKSWYIYAMLMPRIPKMILRRFSGQLLNFAFKQGGLPVEKQPRMKDALSGVVNPSSQYKAFARDFLKMRSEPRVKIKAPTLVIWGKDDAFLSVPKRSEFLKDAEKVTVRLLAGNHWIHREKPDEVNELVAEFIR